MKIRYPTRSVFIDALRAGIRSGRSLLDAGRPIQVRLKPGGYSGGWSVIISRADRVEFKVAGTMRAPTRFPQRIRVAAWALLLEGAFGRFLIEHDRTTGIATIKRLADALADQVEADAPA